MELPNVGIGDVLLLTVIIDLIVYLTCPTFWFVLATVCALTGLYLYQKHAYGVFHRLHIPGPPPTPLAGNLFDVSKKGMIATDMEWTKRYGRVYGTFRCMHPSIVVSDVEMLKNIMVKDFPVFQNRGKHTQVQIKDSIFGNSIVSADDEHWKFLRSTATPAFTAGKMKHMMTLVNRCIDELSSILKETTNGQKMFDVNLFLGGLTMDVICTCAFATETNSLRNPDNELVQRSKKVFNRNTISWDVIARLFFPFVTWKIMPLTGWRPGAEAERFFVKLVSDILKQRKEKGNKNKAYADILHLMTNAHLDDDTDDLITSSETARKQLAKDSQWEKRGLTDIEIAAQSFLFLVAGYHTTATTLTFCLYNLALQQDVQEKCVAELHDQLGTDVKNASSIDYETVRNKLPYLEAVIMESLRMYPPASKADRQVSQDYEINGIKFAKGMSVQIPIHAIHHDPEYYPEPEKFDPNRFLGQEKTKRNPYTWLPFGYGPRNCIGMRFALMEIKMTLANILLQFKFVPCEKTPVPLEVTSNGLLKPVKPVWLGVEERKHSTAAA